MSKSTSVICNHSLNTNSVLELAKDLSKRLNATIIPFIFRIYRNKKFFFPFFFKIKRNRNDGYALFFFFE